MTQQLLTLQGALQSLRIDNTADNNNIITTAGTAPAEILNNVATRTYNILGMTPADIIKEHGSTTMDFNDIKKEFKKICLDFGTILQLEEQSKAVEFCSKMIFEVGPEARQVRKQHGDKTWKCVFLYKVNNRLECKVACVSCTITNMGTQLPTLQAALQSLGIDSNADNNSIVSTVGTPPAEILGNVVPRTYNILGMTPDDFMKEHGSNVMDFKEMKIEFKKICMDYGDPLQLEAASKAVEFCSKMIFEVVPEAGQVRKQHGDKTWKFVFLYKINDRLDTYHDDAYYGGEFFILPPLIEQFYNVGKEFVSDQS